MLQVILTDLVNLSAGPLRASVLLLSLSVRPGEPVACSPYSAEEIRCVFDDI